MNRKEHGGREELQAHDSVMDQLMLPMERAYLMTLARVNASISHALRLSERLNKAGDPLFVSSEEGYLFKAIAKPATPGGRDDRKPTEASSAGSRGSTKWYIDKHGHVRYGVRPSARYSEGLDDEHVKDLHRRLDVVMGYDEDLDAWIRTKWGYANVDQDGINALIRVAKVTGTSLQEVFVGALQEDEGLSEQEATQAYEGLVNSLQAAWEDPDLRKKVEDVIEKRKRQDRSLSSMLSNTDELTSKLHKDFTSGVVSTAGLRALSLLVEYGAVFLPTRKQIASGAAGAGNLHTEDYLLDRMERFSDDMNAGQIMTWAVGLRLSEVINADEDEAAEVAFKDDKGAYRDTLNDDNLEESLISALEKATRKKLTDAEKKQVLAKINEVADYIHQQVNDYNNFRGGDAVGMLLREETTAEKLFADPDAVKFLERQAQEKRDLISRAMAARDDDNFEVSPGVAAGFKGLTAVLRAKGIIGKDKEAGLFAYQKKMVNWMLAIKRGILAADTGLGKTPMAIAAIGKLIEDGKTERGILVLPKGLVKQWPKEIKAFYPDAEVVTLGEGMTMEDRLDVLEAINSGEKKADFVIMSASTMAFDKENQAKVSALQKEFEAKKKAAGRRGGDFKEIEEEFTQQMAELRRNDLMAEALRKLKGAVLYDEAHSASQGLKTKDNVHHQVAIEMMRGREYGWLASATPAPNGEPSEMFTLMNLIHPGSAGESVERFERAVCTYHEDIDVNTGKKIMVRDGVDDWATLGQNIAPYVYAKKKTDDDVVESQKQMGTVLKPANSQEHTLEMDPVLQGLYANAGKYKPHNAGENWKSFEELKPLAQQLRILDQMQKMAISPRLVFGPKKEDWPPGYNGKDPKIEHMADLLLKHFNAAGNEDHPVVVFSRFPSAFEYVKEALMERGIDPSLIGEIHGDVKQEDRDTVQEAVNAGKMKICLVGVESGGAGLNLQKKANKVIFLDKPWSPHHVDQAIGRVHRTGQTDTVDVIHMKLQGAIDEKHLAKLKKKIMTSEAALYSTLGADYANQTTTAAIIKLLGTTDEKQLSHEEIQRQLSEMGLTGQSAPAVLKQQFNVKKFKDEVDFKTWREFGDQYVDVGRVVNDTRYKQGKITKEEYLKRKERLARDEMAWHAAVSAAGDKDVAVPKKGNGKSVTPPREFLPNSKAKVEHGTIDHEIISAMQNKRVRTPEDLVDKVVLPRVSSQTTPEIAEGMRDRLIKVAREHFDRLEKLGHIMPRTWHGETEEEEAPPKKGKAAPAKETKPSKPAAAKPALKPVKAPEKKAMSVLGSTYTVQAKTHPKLKGDAKIVWADFVKLKPKNFDDALKKLAGGAKDAGTKAAVKQFIQQYIDLGLIG